MESTINLDKLAKSSKKTAWASLAGVLIVVLSLVYSAYMLHDLKNKIEEKQKELRDITIEKEKLQKDIIELEKRISQTMIFDRNRYQFNWAISKTLASNYRIARLIEDLISMKYQNIAWKLGGTSPETGFDSPSFAAYLLIKKYNVLDVDFSKRYNLRNILPKTNNPEPGDLIFYDTGYTMFYFRDQSNHPFCIGMTPLGIVALEINFGPALLNYAKVDYRN